MAVGDTVSAWTSTSTTSTLTVQPGSGVEWLVHTVLTEASKGAEIYVTSDAGSTWTKVDTLTGGSVHGLIFRLTNSIYIRIKNTEGDTRYLGYMGVITK